MTSHNVCTEEGLSLCGLKRSLSGAYRFHSDSALLTLKAILSHSPPADQSLDYKTGKVGFFSGARGRQGAQLGTIAHFFPGLASSGLVA